MKDLHADTEWLFLEAQGLVDAAPYQDDLDIDPAWLRRERRRQLDRQRKQDARDTEAILEQLRASVVVRLCACGCGETVQGRGKYASDQCREAARQERDRERKAQARADALRQIREAEGIEERECARDGCGVLFPVKHGPGRPQEYCSRRCASLAGVRAWKERIKRRLFGSDKLRPPQTVRIVGRTNCVRGGGKGVGLGRKTQ